ncbi:hypothetical protein GTQ99_00325 [Kineococcus sp. T13]|uniref:hypothetical protein n=1 Tax=Kineococcus vitellinus TaxID=2696565 RepID=UPI0014128AA1|nr:hypothetical protein [Kineococcus vitellinus]NAZ73876.1 hypothetical protein [Kineococcus vitellinus]
MTNKITVEVIQGDEVLRDTTRPKLNTSAAVMVAAINSLIDDVAAIKAVSSTNTVVTYDASKGYPARPADLEDGLWWIVGPVDSVDRLGRDVWIETED